MKANSKPSYRTPVKRRAVKISKAKWREIFQILHAARDIPAAVLADKAGVSAATISNLRRGFVTSPRNGTLEKMGKALGLLRIWVTRLDFENGMADKEDEAVNTQTSQRLALLKEAKARQEKRSKGGNAKPVALRHRKIKTGDNVVPFRAVA